MADAAWWEYDQLESRIPCDWSPATRGDDPWDQIDFHIDLGCGTVPKARLGIDRFYAPGVGLAWDLDSLSFVPAPDDCSPEIEAVAKRGWELAQSHPHHALHMLPFPDNSIKSIITHHCLEHVGEGFIRLMDECYRVLEPGGFMRIIVPLFPSHSAMFDPDHKRMFLEGAFETFCGAANGEHWMESFSVPYTSARFKMVKEDRSPMTPPEDQWKKDKDAREMRVTLQKWPS